MHTDNNPSEIPKTPQMGWLDICLRWSLHQRVFVLLGAAGLLVWGILTIQKMPVDVLPDLTAPTVAVLTEAHGLNSTEVERLVTQPLESALNGATGVRRLRSSSTAGFSIVWVEFDWDTDVFRARQMVTQRVYAAEIDVVLQMKDRTMAALLKELRASLAAIPGLVINIGQPISHRIDHMLSGSRSAIAIKLFGPHLPQLIQFGEQIRAVVTTIPGAVDVVTEPLIQVPHYQLNPRKDAIARYGLSASELMEKVELALWGEIATHLFEGRMLIPVRVRTDYPAITNKQQLARLPLMISKNVSGPLEQFAHIQYTWGPNRINREFGQRRIIISANSAQTDLIGLVKQIQEKVKSLSLPQGYYVEYGGQFEREASARKTLLWLGLLVLCGTFFLLRLAFQSTPAAWLVLINLPLALIGGVVAIAITGEVLSIASIVGFIALFGVATRNGIIMVSHYQHLHREGHTLAETVIQGSLERLNPILMTALTTGLGMIPLLLAGGAPGNELQSPMALVILGGIFSATLLNLLVLPVLYHKFAPTNDAPPNRMEIQSATQTNT